MTSWTITGPRQEPVEDRAKKHPDRLVVSYGGGVNSVAVLVYLAKKRIVPKAIVMADPGSERKSTVDFRDNVLPAWLKKQGFPSVTVISRVSESEYRERISRVETLEEECFRSKTLPSVAYGWKKCSLKHKADPQRWWIERQPWAFDAWDSGEKLIKVMGYDYDEPRRIRRSFNDELENSRFEPWYPLFDSEIDRDECISMIEESGLPVPTKSSCTFCPNNTLQEWRDLEKTEPEAFKRALKMSRVAAKGLTSPDVVGLMRCSPHGKRQLHLWHQGAYPDLVEKEIDDDPCECAL